MKFANRAVGAVLAALTTVFNAGDAAAESYKLVRPSSLPPCHTADGEKVRFVANSKYDVAFAYRVRPGQTENIAELKADGLPHAVGAYVVYNPGLLRTMRPETQKHVLGHECSHHALGHTDELYPTAEEVARAEAEADCNAVKIMRDQYNMSAADIKRGIEAFMTGPQSKMTAAQAGEHDIGVRRYERSLRCLTR
jgi:hypothetical protein